MGMKVDTAKARRVLYGITMGMTNQELVQYSGYSIYAIRSIRKDPEKYKKALQERAKKEDEQRRKREYVSTFKEGVGGNHKLDKKAGWMEEMRWKNVFKDKYV